MEDQNAALVTAQEELRKAQDDVKKAQEDAVAAAAATDAKLLEAAKFSVKAREA